jgi:putative colanic acid biosysnthesis UDP-glucose lipid carrier transferase
MPLRHSKYFPAISLSGDFVLLNLFFVFGFVFSSDTSFNESRYLLFYLNLNFFWTVLVVFFGAFRIDRNTGKRAIFLTYTQIVIFFFFVFLMYFQFTSLSYYPRTFIKFLFPAFFISLLVWKYSLYYAFRFYRKKGFNSRKVLLVGYNQLTLKLYNYFKSNIWHGYNCIGIVDSATENPMHKIGNLNDLPGIINKQKIDEIFIALEAIGEKEKSDLIEVLNNFPVKIRFIPDLGNFAFQSSEIVNFGNLPVIVTHPGPLSYWYNQLIKRVFDLGVSVIVIVSVLSWLSILLYVINLFTDRRGVFFFQKRTSLNGKTFTIIKFRSMIINDEADTKKASENDQRITKTGMFLRKTSLDELPQFFNVFMGQMSIVGPRPHMLKHTEQYSKIVKGFLLRHSVKSGITGLAQVNGFRGEVKKLSDIRQRVEFDMNYIKHWSFNLDIKIILQTFLLLFKG